MELSPAKIRSSRVLGAQGEAGAAGAEGLVGRADAPGVVGWIESGRSSVPLGQQPGVILIAAPAGSPAPQPPKDAYFSSCASWSQLSFTVIDLTQSH